MKLLNWFSKNRHLKEMELEGRPSLGSARKIITMLIQKSLTLSPPTYSRDPVSSKARFSIIPDQQSSYQAVPSVLGIGREGRYNLVPVSSRQMLCLKSSYDCLTIAAFIPQLWSALYNGKSFPFI